MSIVVCLFTDKKHKQDPDKDSGIDSSMFTDTRSTTCSVVSYHLNPKNKYVIENMSIPLANYQNKVIASLENITTFYSMCYMWNSKALDKEYREEVGLKIENRH